MDDNNTFSINRLDLRRVLLNLGLSEKNIASLFSMMEKSHRHINAITLASTFEKMGITRDRIKNVFRRFGMSDTRIHRIMNQIDEQRIINETGKLYEATLDNS